MTYVYVISADNGPIKVGCTNQPRERFYAFQSSSPNVLRVVAICPGAKLLEKTIKNKWKPHRLWGEWFKPAKTVLLDAERLNAIGALAFLAPGQLDADTESIGYCGHKVNDAYPHHPFSRVPPHHSAYPKIPPDVKLGPLVDPALIPLTPADLIAPQAGSYAA